jgi:hypothetical protein
MKRVGQRGGDGGEIGALLLHCRPFVIHGALDMAADQRAHPYPQVRREVVAQDDNRSQGARLVSHRFLGTVDIAPHADGQEADEQREKDAHRRQHPGRNGLQRGGTLTLGQQHYHGIDGRGEQRHAGEHHQSDPNYRQVR